MNTQDKIKFAVVGCGHIGKRHAEMIVRNEESELVALCDIKEKGLLGIDSYQVPFYDNIDEMLKNEPEIEVLNVCTPNGLHTLHSLKGLDHQKHIVCEKPLGLSKASVEEVIHKSLSVSRQVFAVMQNRYSPPSRWIKEIVDKEILGKIFMIQVNCYWNRDERYYKKGNWKGDQKLDGGTLFTQFSHFIDIMFWLFGDITNIHAHFDDFNHKGITDFEDSGSVIFRLSRSGAIGCLNYSTSVYQENLESSMTIIGENGSVKIGGQYMNEVEYCNIKNYTMPELEPSSPANDYGNYKGSAANHHFVIQNVVDSIKGRTTATTNVLEGMKVVEIIERIYKLRPNNILQNTD